MAWSQEISQLSTDIAQLTNEINVQKNQLSGAVTSAQSSRITANTGAAVAESSVVPSTTNMLSANTFKNSVLSIYGTQAAQRASIDTATAQASAAATSAATATAGLTQDLSGVTAQALHRSPNAVTSMFIYDTSKDSDGGAWTEKCQHTSWYNESISGKWLGPQLSELEARRVSATLGNELVTNGTFDSGTTGWTGGSGAGVSVVSGGLLVDDPTSSGFANQTVTTIANRYYKITGQFVAATASCQPAVWVGTSNLTSNLLSLSFATGYTGAFTAYFLATSTTSFLSIGYTSGPGQNVTIDNISVREVTAITTESSDYFQLTTDGKFYRLWKNLLKWSEDFSNAAWEKSNITVSSTQFVAPDGTTTADLIYPTTSGTSRYVNQPVGNGIVGDNHTYTVYLKSSGITKAYIYTMQGNALVYFDLDANSVLSTPTVGTGGFVSASIRDAGNGWRACTVVSALTSGANRHCYTGPCDANASTTVTANGTNGILIWGTQLEAGSVATTYEAKTIASTTSEVFRGNKRDFPRLAGIVCQSTGSNASQVAIYDLTEPGRPMWMAFVDYSLKSTVTKLLDWNGDDNGWSHVAMMNGWLVGTSNTSAGMCHFIKDWIAGSLGVEFSRNSVSDRNNVGTVTSTGRLTFSTAQNNSARTVRMLVEPNAPIEPETGLPRPSILIGSTQPTYNSPTGASFLYHTTANYDDVVFFPRLIAARRGFNSFSPNFFYTINPGLSSAVSGEITATSAPDFALGGNTAKLIGAANGEFLRAPAASLVQKLKLNASAVAKSLTATIRNTFNTGWMHGDIRRVYLSDTDTGSTTGPELVVNGTFDTNTTGWAVNFAGATLSWDTLRASAKVIVGGIGQGITQTSWTPIVGRWYRITFTATNGAAVSRGFAVTFGGTGIDIAPVNPGQSRTFTATVFATSTANLIIRNAGSDTVSGETFFYDNISVREVVLDRSYKAQSAHINGIVTRSQAAAGTSLVGYSGFSTTNYLQEPYSADLDFGTGEFSVSAWVNIPVSMPTTSFPVIQNIITDFSSQIVPRNVNSTLVSRTATAITVQSVGSGTFGIGVSGITTIAGKTYKLTLTLIANQNRNITVGVGNNYVNIAPGANNPITTTLFLTAGTTNAFDSFISATGAGETLTISNISIHEVSPAIIADRAHSSGTKISLGVNGAGQLTTTAFDGTTTRTAMTTTAYNTGQWLKAEANYTTDGSLAIRVNGREVAVTRGNPLLSLNSKYNLLTWSEDLTINSWVKSNVTISATPGVAPDGTMTADLLYPTSSGNNRWVYQAYSGASAIYTASVYAKAAGKSFICVDISGGGASAYFNVSTGQVGTVSAGYAASIEPVGNGWYRCSIRNTSSQVTSFAGVYAITDADNNSRVVTSNGTDGILFWGAQIEVSSTATTYQRVAATAETNVAPLTIGNSYTLDAPFPGSIALLKLGATVPTPEQSTFIYEQEKQLFRPGALSVLPDANAIIDMSYDDATDRWAAVSTTNESYWNGLVRSSVTAVPAGSYSRVATTSGVELVATTTTNPGVYVSIPPHALREELVKRSEAAGKLVRKTVTYDYTGGFTGNITTGSTSIVSVAGLVYPTSYIGARISGTGIPANTVITGVSGTTIYISAPATATTNTLAITFLDFNLPVGMEAKVVLSAGVIRREGSTSDYTRLFDGFIETIRFAVAPGSTAWVQIQATRTAQ